MKRVLVAILLVTASVFAAPTPLEQDKWRFPSAVADHGMVVCGDPMSARAGIEVMKEGGNAVDAVITTALAEAVTLPRAGNIGGGGFMLIRNPQGEVYALDFRQTAPGKSTRDMFVDFKGDRDEDKATVGGLSVAVPGTVAGLDEARRRYGTIPWKRAVQPARKLAEEGFIVPDWLEPEVERVRVLLERFPDSKKIFFPGGKPLQKGTIWKQPELAATFAILENEGAQAFYQGPIAQKIAASVQRHGGIMTEDDLARYKPVWRTPVVGQYRGYRIHSMPPPSSGGIAIIQSLNVLSGFDLQASGHNSALTLHRIVETLRQAFADRARWLGDPDFVKVPVAWLTSPEYARTIRLAIPEGRARTSDKVQAGKPPRRDTESHETTQICAVDNKGWAVSLTYTLNFSYGSGLVAEGTGILLNNEMDDFAAGPGKPNAFGLIQGEANAIQPNKRPLSSMSPTVVQREGKLVAVLGSPGGSRIITVVLQVLLNMIDFDYNSQTCVGEARLHHQWYPDQVEVEQGFSPDTLAILKSWGHNVLRADSLGHAMLIRVRRDGGLEGGVDPRRTGGAAAGF